MTIEVKEIADNLYALDFNSESVGKYLATGTKEKCEDLFKQVVSDLNFIGYEIKALEQEDKQ